MTAIVIRDGTDTARFDSGTEMWTVTTTDGHTQTAPVVIDARPSPDQTIAAHGIPNHFRIPGPQVERQTRYVQRCLDLLERSGASRIEARSRITLGRWNLLPLSSKFYLSGTTPAEDDLYEGPATMDGITVRARLAGHLDAIDGRYHWRGTIAGDLPADLLKGSRTVQLATPGYQASARVTEKTPWGDYTVTGSGTPPFCP
ncbi:hypothetical protein BH11ACT7_BH11ACT7_10550 [soil metagenome]